MVIAAAFRMEALATTIRDARFQSWRSAQQPNGAVLVPKEVFDVAATTDLIIDEDGASFDISSFMDELLAKVAPGGKA